MDLKWKEGTETSSKRCSGVGGSFVGEDFQSHGIRYPKIVLGKSHNVIKNNKRVRYYVIIFLFVF